MKLNYHDRSNWARYVTKTKEESNMNERIGVIYTKKETELSWLIRSNVVYDKNQIG